MTLRSAGCNFNNTETATIELEDLDLTEVPILTEKDLGDLIAKGWNIAVTSQVGNEPQADKDIALPILDQREPSTSTHPSSTDKHLNDVVGSATATDVVDDFGSDECDTSGKYKYIFSLILLLSFFTCLICFFKPPSDDDDDAGSVVESNDEEDEPPCQINQNETVSNQPIRDISHALQLPELDESMIIGANRILSSSRNDEGILNSTALLGDMAHIPEAPGTIQNFPSLCQY